MDELQRLELIAEAVRYCQRVQAMGMPPSCYSKALREPVHFLWERRSGKGKAACAQYRSRQAIGLRSGDGSVIYDHAIPFRILQQELLNLPEVTADAVRDVLERHCTVVLITKEENARLNKAKLGSRMPDSDQTNPLARYAAAGIDIVPNR